MKYTITQFNKNFPTDSTYLDCIFTKKYDATGYYKITKLEYYTDSREKQTHPLKDTIFKKSSTSLKLWFYAIYMFSQSKNGVSAKKLQRQSMDYL